SIREASDKQISRVAAEHQLRLCSGSRNIEGVRVRTRFPTLIDLRTNAGRGLYDGCVAQADSPGHGLGLAIWIVAVALDPGGQIVLSAGCINCGQHAVKHVLNHLLYRTGHHLPLGNSLREVIGPVSSVETRPW